MTKTNVSYTLCRGDTTWSVNGPPDWQVYDIFESLAEAKKEALQVDPKGYWRIERTETVWLKGPE